MWPGHDVGDEGARIVSEVLEKNSELISIDLACDDISIVWMLKVPSF